MRNPNNDHSETHSGPDGFAPTIRLFNAESVEDGSPSREWPLSRLFRESFIPSWIHGNRLAPETLAAYTEAVDWWIAITHDPPIKCITDEMCIVFLESLSKQPGRKSEFISPMTVRKHAVSISKLLAFAGPKTRDRFGRKNQHVIDDPPWLEKPPKMVEAPDGEFTHDEILAMLAKCHRRRQPKIPGVATDDWWRAMLIVACYTGLRIGTLMQLEFSHIREGGWLVIPANIVKGRKRGIKQYLHPEARKAIESIRTSRRMIFDWPDKPWPSKTLKRSLNRILHRLMDKAGIPKERQRWRAFHACRKYHLTSVYSQAGSPREAEAAAQASAGHTQKGTTLGHYVAGSAQERMLASAIERLPSLEIGPTAPAKHPSEEQTQ